MRQSKGNPNAKRSGSAANKTFLYRGRSARSAEALGSACRGFNRFHRRFAFPFARKPRSLLLAALLPALLAAPASAPASRRSTTSSGGKSRGLGARAYLKTVDQWTLYRKALGDEKQRHGKELRRALLDLRKGLGGGPLRLLDVGVADGELTSAYSDLANPLVALDISAKLLDQAQKRPELSQAQWIQGDIEDLWRSGKEAHALKRRLGDGYDAIVISHVLFALDDPIATVDATAKLLRKGGKIFIVAVNEHDEMRNFQRRFATRTRLNLGLNLPHTKLVAALRRLGYQVALRALPGTFTASTAEMMAMAPILGDASRRDLEKNPHALTVLGKMVGRRASAGRVRLSNESVLIEVTR